MAIGANHLDIGTSVIAKVLISRRRKLFQSAALTRYRPLHEDLSDFFARRVLGGAGAELEYFLGVERVR
jgi:hypothetical protein